jgi:predicted nuclease with TOPRIM domain
VNVRAITKALGLRQSQEQHFFKKRELALAINELAKVQGLRGINSRQLQDVEDRVQTERIHKVVQHNTDLSRSLAEREAVIERQRREIEALRAQLALLEETGMAIRTSKVR